MPKISLVIPTYNIENYIGKCLESIKNQSYEDFVCLVIVDGATDNSEAIARAYEKDKRFKVYVKENGGLSDARNYGLKLVDTDYVMFVDGDDYLEPNCLKRTVETIEKDKTDIVVFNYYQSEIATGNKEVISASINLGVYKLKDNKELLFKTPNAAWNKIYRTELLKKNNIEYPFKKRYEDLGTTPKLLYLANSISYIDEPLYNYLIDRPNNITTQIDAKLYDLFDVSKDIIEFYKDNNVFEEYKYELDCLIERNIVSALRKVVSLKDKEFVNEFIDHAFSFREFNFGKIKQKYNLKYASDDEIYLNKFLCKTYYMYKRLKHE